MSPRLVWLTGLALMAPSGAAAQLEEVRQTIFGMD
jgi:hypothetical protein